MSFGGLDQAAFILMMQVSWQAKEDVHRSVGGIEESQVFVCLELKRSKSAAGPNLVDRPTIVHATVGALAISLLVVDLCLVADHDQRVCAVRRMRLSS